MRPLRFPGGLVGEGDLRDLELDGAGVVVDVIISIAITVRIDVIVIIIVVIRTLQFIALVVVLQDVERHVDDLLVGVVCKFYSNSVIRFIQTVIPFIILFVISAIVPILLDRQRIDHRHRAFQGLAALDLRRDGGGAGLDGLDGCGACSRKSQG